MFGSSIFSTALRHCVGIPFLFNDPPASCQDPLSFRRLSNIIFGTPFFSVALQYCVRISFFSAALRHPASCSDPLPFWQSSGIVSGSPIFSTALWQHARIPYLFSGSPTSCLDILVLNHSDPIPLAFSIVMQGQNCWPLFSSLEFISTPSSLALCPLTLACILGVSPAPNFFMSRPWSPY